MVTREGSLLLSVRNTPPGAAGFDSVTGSTTDDCGATVIPDARAISERVVTVTVALADATFGAVVVAAITAVPAPAAVTGTLTVVAFAGKLTVDGTPATFVLLDVRETMRPVAGAGAERVNVKFSVLLLWIVTLEGAKASAATTLTDSLAAL
jgi:hypothetical protein